MSEISLDEKTTATVSSFVLVDPRDAFRESLMEAMQPLPFACLYSVSSVDALPTELARLAGVGSGNREDPDAALDEKPDHVNTLVVLGTGALDRNTLLTDIEKLRRQLQSVRIALLTDRVDDIHNELYENGIADGIVPSTFGIKQLRACFAIIGEGVAFAPRPGKGGGVSHSGQRQFESNAFNANGIGDTTSRLTKILTERQIQVMEYVKLGKSNKFIAEKLDLRESTVKVHVHESMKRLGASSRTHASYIISNMLEREPSVK